MSTTVVREKDLSTVALPAIDTSQNHSKSLRFSLFDGFFYSLMVGFGETYFSAFAVFLGANNFQLAMLSSLPQFCGGMSQFFTLRILDRWKSRQLMVTRFALAQGCFLIPIFLSAFVPGISPELFLFFVICYFVSGQVVGPVWNSWIGDLVPHTKRGIYFGKRNRMITIGTFLSMVTAGYILQRLAKTPVEIYAFGIIFFLGFLARVVSFMFLRAKDEPQYQGTQTHLDHFFSFLSTMLSRNEGRLIVYMASVNFSVFVSAAFCVPYLLKTLHLSYTWFVVITSSVALAKVLSSGFWGVMVDSLGARKVVRICGLLLPFSILPWAFTDNPYLLVVANLMSGFMWAGYELSTFTFLLDAIRPADRARVTSYSSLLTNCAALGGGIVGTLIVSLGPQPMHEYAVVFIVSAILRLVAYCVFVPSLSEVRVLAQVKTVDVLVKAVGFRPSLGFTTRLVVLARRKSK